MLRTLVLTHDKNTYIQTSFSQEGYESKSMRGGFGLKLSGPWYITELVVQEGGWSSK